VSQQVGDPEWARSAHVFTRFGIGRTALERLAREGQIKSVTIKLKASSRRTTRLYLVSSIREFLAELASRV
jgi:hypothetical protein